MWNKFDGQSSHRVPMNTTPTKSRRKETGPRNPKTPIKNTRLAQMLNREQIKQGKTETDIAAEYGWLPQSFNVWKRGTAPRRNMWVAIARFLQISLDQVEELVEEAKVSTGNTKIPNMGAPVMGKGSGDTAIMDSFPSGFAQPSVVGCYAVRIGDKTYWVNPRLKPRDGNTVLVRTNDVGKLMTWPNEYQADGVEQHVVVLAEMI
jgi:hypothetical protein